MMRHYRCTDPKEKVTFVTVLSTIIACGGIYLLTLNQVNHSSEENHAILGYMLAFSSAWLFGGIFVWIRYLNTNGVHPIMSSFSVGMGITLQTIVAYFIGILHIDQYDFIDILLLFGVGVVNFIGQLWMSLANKYSMASKMAPFNNLEIVVTILADIFIFHYVRHLKPKVDPKLLLKTFPITSTTNPLL